MTFNPTSIKLYTTCREAWRYRYVEGIVSAGENIHLSWGRVIHRIPEGYWQGLDPHKVEAACLTEASKLVAPNLSGKNRSKWLNLMDSLSQTIDLYFEFHGNERDTIRPLMLEQAWEHGPINGRIDQLLLIPHFCKESSCTDRNHHTGTLELRELKTASEIVSEEVSGRFGFSDNMRDRWRKEYHEQLLRNTGILVYDWYLCQVDKPPVKITVEVIIKPYRDKEPSIEMFDITEEVISYRERTAQQIRLITEEMQINHKIWAELKPWPMSESACFTKYGTCEYLPLCNHGVTEKNLKLYKIKEKV